VSRIANLLSILVLAAGLLGSGIATAQDYARMGPYIRGGATFSFENSQMLQEVRDFFDVTGSTDTFIGGEGAIGYRVHPYFAFEAEFEYLGKATTKVDVPQPVDAGEIKLWDVTANGRLYPLTGRINDRFQPFLAVGLGYGTADIMWSAFTLANTGGFLTNESEGGFVAKFGGGLDVYLSEGIALYVDGNYILTTGDIENNDVANVGVGAMFRF